MSMKQISDFLAANPDGATQAEIKRNLRLTEDNVASSLRRLMAKLQVQAVGEIGKRIYRIRIVRFNGAGTLAAMQEAARRQQMVVTEMEHS